MLKDFARIGIGSDAGLPQRYLPKPKQQLLLSLSNNYWISSF